MKQALKAIVIITIVLSLGFLFAADYVGSAACAGCHGAADLSGTGYDIYTNWEGSGHPWKANVIDNNNPPPYPSVAADNNFMADWMTGLGTAWEDIALVIGGYGWKARFVGHDGVIIGTASSSVHTDGHNQFNFYGGVNHGWVDYDKSTENKKYNYGCFKCHTTGPSTEGSWLPDLGLGTFAEGGVGCEGCHGPGSDHAAGPTAENIARAYINPNNDGNGLDYGGAGGNGVVMAKAGSVTTTDDVVTSCGMCHNRSFTAPINSSGGFIKHHEQWDEFIATGHFENGGQSCVTCHDPHKRVIWDGDGITKTCETCHTTQAALINHEGTQSCVECHMPYAAKSGTTRGESGFQGDIRSHLMKITVKDESMFDASGDQVRDDVDRPASLSLEYSCLGCHNADSNDAISDKTLAEALASAGDMHKEQTTVGVEDETTVPGTFRLHQNYPNPFNPNTKITFDLSQSQEVHLAVYDLLGQEVSVLTNGLLPAGSHEVNWDGISKNGEQMNSGVYLAKLITENQTQSVKMILMK
jgi:hypothetical protein